MVLLRITLRSRFGKALSEFESPDNPEIATCPALRHETARPGRRSRQTYAMISATAL
jgi:hypothetical protein